MPPTLSCEIRGDRARTTTRQHTDRAAHAIVTQPLFYACGALAAQIVRLDLTLVCMPLEDELEAWMGLERSHHFFEHRQRRRWQLGGPLQAWMAIEVNHQGSFGSSCMRCCQGVGVRVHAHVNKSQACVSTSAKDRRLGSRIDWTTTKRAAATPYSTRPLMMLGGDASARSC